MKWLHLEIRDLKTNQTHPSWVSLRYDQITAYEEEGGRTTVFMAEGKFKFGADIAIHYHQFRCIMILAGNAKGDYSSHQADRDAVSRAVSP